MSKNKNIEEENKEEWTEEVEVAETHKPTIPVQKVSKVPHFPNAHQFGKGWLNNNFSNKQRPWRAAARWR